MTAVPHTGEELSLIAGFSVIIDPPGDPAANMAADSRLVEDCRKGAHATLRIYRWNQVCVTLGRRQSSSELPVSLLQRKLPMVHRPTGGGAVVHSEKELTYALAMPRSAVPLALSIRDLPKRLHQSLRNLLVEGGWISAGDLRLWEGSPDSSASLCFSSPAEGDLLYRGRKVAGAALRVWRDGILIQGSLKNLPMGYPPLADALPKALSSILDAGSLSGTLSASG